MRTWWTIVTAGAVGAAAWAQPVPAPQGTACERSLRAAAGLLQRGMPDAAIDEYRAALGAGPSTAQRDEAHYGLAVALARQGKRAEAERELDMMAPGGTGEYAADAGVLRAECAIARGDWTKAASAAGGVIRDYPKSPACDAARVLWGEALVRSGRHEDAIKVLGDDGAWTGAAPARAAYLRGLAEMGLKKFEAARDRLGAVRRAGGELAASAGVSEASCLVALGQSGEAEKLLEVAATSADARVRADALLVLAGIKRQAGAPMEALQALDKMDERERQTPRALLERGRVLRALSRGGEAEAALRKAGGEDGSSPDAAYWLAVCENERGAYPAAAGRLTSLLRGRTGDELTPWMLRELATALDGAGRASDADRVRRELVKAYPEHEAAASAVVARANSLLMSGDATGARRGAEAWLAAHPDSLQARLVLAEALLAEGKGAEAVGAYDAYLRGEPKAGPDIAIKRGLALLAAGRPDDAGTALRTALAKEGASPGVTRAGRVALADMDLGASRWAEAGRAFAAVAADESAPNDVRASCAVKAGVAQRRGGDAPGATATLEGARKLAKGTPLEAAAEFELGQAQRASGRDDDAARAFERAISLEEGVKDRRYTPEALRQLAAVRSAQGRTADAADLLMRASKDGGGVELARALLAAGRPAEALRAAQSAQGQEAKALAGIALSRMGKAAEAVKMLDGLAGVPEDVAESAACERAWSLRALGRGADAATVWAEVASSSKKPSIVAACELELAQEAAGGGKFEEALSHLDKAEQAAKAVPPGAGARRSYLRGVSLQRLGKSAEAAAALEVFKDSLSGAEVAGPALLVLAEAYMSLERPGEAAAVLGRLAGRPSEGGEDRADPAVLLRWGEALGTAGDWGASAGAYRRFLGEHGSDAQWFRAAFGLGWALQQTGDLEGAMAAYRRVIEGHDGATAARAQFQIGECLYAAKKYAEASAALMKVDVLYAYPEWSAPALFEAGRCLQEAGRADDAKAAWRQVVERFGGTSWAAKAKEKLGG